MHEHHSPNHPEHQLGRAYISEDAVAGNTATPNANDVAPMEGLITANPDDQSVRYGGGDDDDDSGTIAYVCSRSASAGRI